MNNKSLIIQASKKVVEAWKQGYTAKLHLCSHDFSYHVDGSIETYYFQIWRVMHLNKNKMATEARKQSVEHEHTWTQNKLLYTDGLDSISRL